MPLILLVTALLSPFSVFAATIQEPTDLKSFLGVFNGIFTLLIPLIFALTFLTIAWGVVKAWIMGDASSEDVENGKKIAIVGVIALAVMSAIWGILRFLRLSLFG